MLTVATLGMLLYGVYSIGDGLADLFGPSAHRLWANVALLFFGALLIAAAPLVRVVLPGGLALAIGALLGLQAVALLNTFHVHGDPLAPLQLARAGFAGVLVGLAWAGARRESRGRPIVDI